MAKKQRVNKTQMVRDYLKAHPGTANKEVVAALDKAGVKITANYVGNIKASTKKKNGKRGAKGAKGTAARSDMSQLKAALAFVKASGSVSAAKQSLVAAEEVLALV